jgi:hypothetical protein
VYIGAYAWSSSNAAGNSSSACGATTASGVSVSVSNASSYKCSAVTMSGGVSNGVNSYGGSMNIVYIGAFAWSIGSADSNSASLCGTTTASGVSVSVSNAPSSNCSGATTLIGGSSSGANSYGGSMSILYIGAYAWSMGLGTGSASSYCDLTRATGLSILINTSSFFDSLALSRKFCCVFRPVVQIISSVRKPQRSQCTHL